MNVEMASGVSPRPSLMVLRKAAGGRAVSSAEKPFQQRIDAALVITRLDLSFEVYRQVSNNNAWLAAAGKDVSLQHNATSCTHKPGSSRVA